MAIFINKLSGREEAQLFLHGAVLGGVNLASGSGKHLFAHGKTLIFTAPGAVTVTFAATPAHAQAPMSVQEILDQIDAQTTSAVRAGLIQGRLFLVKAGVPNGPVAITGLGTANALLGLPDSDTAGVFYNPPSGAAPRMLSVAEHPSGSPTYLVVTERT